jgi:predicted permease
MRLRRASGFFDRNARDLRFAARALRRRPTFTLAAVATLALGIGANTAVFTIVNAVVLRPLPFAQPDRLVRVWSANPRGIARNSVSPPDFFDFRDEAGGSSAVASLAAFTQGDSATLVGAEPQRVLVSMVSPTLFDTLGVAPAQGRTLVSSDAVDGAAAVAIASDAFAKRNGFNIGTQLRIDDGTVTVAGVMPASFVFPSPAVDLWVPLPESLRQRSRSAHYLDVVGRLAHGVSVERATDALRTIAARLATDYPSTNRGWGVTVVSLHESVTGDARTPLLVLLAAVGCVLLIACANVAGLTLANGHERIRELSLRAAIGATPGRLLRQQLLESLLIAVAGGTAAILLAHLSLSALQQLGGLVLPRAESIALDWRVLCVTALVSIATGLLAGAAPAFRASRSDPELSLKGTRVAGLAAPARRVRSILVAAQIAITLCLAVGAGLLVRSFVQLTAVDAGFDARDVVLAQVAFAGSRFEPERWASDVKRGVEELRALPGVVAVGAGSPLPLAGQAGLLRFGVKLEGRPAPADGRSDRAYLRWATPGYFDAMGIALVRGRSFQDFDEFSARPVAVVDTTFVTRFFPGEDPLGRRIQMSNQREPREIIGIVGAVKQSRLEDAADPHVYVPQAQNPSPAMTFVVRSAADPATLAAAVRDRLRQVHPSRPVYNVRTGRDLIAGTLASRRLNTMLVALFAALAGALTMVGMYGLMANAVIEGRKEFGVRLALGASRREVIGMVFRRALAVTIAGILVGVPLALGSVRIVQGMLFETAPRDLATLAGACLALLGIALVASYVPARRAVAANPVDSLRVE